MKDVKKQRIKDEEERVYSAFFAEKQKEAAKHNCDKNEYKSKTLTETFQDIDRELMRLDADVLPEKKSQFNSKHDNHPEVLIFI